MSFLAFLERLTSLPYFSLVKKQVNEMPKGVEQFRKYFSVKVFGEFSALP